MPRLLRFLGCGAALVLGALATARAHAPPQATTAIHWRGSGASRCSPRLHASSASCCSTCTLCGVTGATLCSNRLTRTPRSIALIDQRYLAVSIDADSDPDLAGRYGDWGWPATIVLAADGTEIVKRRGFLPPGRWRTAAGHHRRPDPRTLGASAGGEPGAGGALVSAAQRAAFSKHTMRRTIPGTAAGAAGRSSWTRPAWNTRWRWSAKIAIRSPSSARGRR